VPAAPFKSVMATILELHVQVLAKAFVKELLLAFDQRGGYTLHVRRFE